MRLPRSRPTLKSRTMALIAAAPLVAGGLMFAAAPNAIAAPAYPAHYAAPYLQISTGDSGDMAADMAATGLKYYTLAFLTTQSGCTPAWEDGGESVGAFNSQIDSLQAAGGNVIISFGGAGSEELAQSCTTVSSLTAAYANVVNTTGVDRLDFDIEGSVLSDTAATSLRDQALAALQAENPAVQIDFTLAVAPNGLPTGSGSEYALLQDAQSKGVKVSVVNIMTMDFGDGQNALNDAESAAQATASQLSGLYGISTTAAYNMMGLTPIAGQNDDNEDFTQANASTLESFAASNGVGELSFWEVDGYDKPLGYAYSKIFNAITSSSGGGTTPEGPYGGTPAAVPGTVQAANYDTGGQGTGYSVSSVNGSSNSYRSDGVDLEASTDTVDTTGGGAYDLGWTTGGQWFRYTVNVATAGTYTVSLRLAAPTAVTDGLHIANSSGTNLSGDVNVPATGGWQDWATVTASVTLPAGQQTLTIDQDNAGWNIHYAAFALASSGGDAPYGGTAVALPGTVQAANYDTGGQGVAYNATSTNGTANTYRTDGIDLEASSDTVDTTGGGAYDLGWTTGGQWFHYTVNVATAGTYTVSLRLAAPTAVTDGLHIANAAGTNLSGSVAVPATGGWQDWATVTASVTLPAGVQTLTVAQDNAGWNIHYLGFASAGTGINSSSWYEVINENSGLCETATGASTANGTAVEQQACTGATSQLWQFVPAASGYYEVLNENAQSEGEAWNITGGTTATASGALVQTWDYAANTNEEFSATLGSSGYYTFVADNSGLCIDTPGASTASGVQLEQYTCNGTGAQEFSLVL